MGQFGVRTQGGLTRTDTPFSVSAYTDKIRNWTNDRIGVRLVSEGTWMGRPGLGRLARARHQLNGTRPFVRKGDVAGRCRSISATRFVVVFCCAERD